MEFCCGCWLEGGLAADASPYHPGFGDIYTALPEFVRAGKVNIVHFRNISAPLPAFVLGIRAPSNCFWGPEN